MKTKKRVKRAAKTYRLFKELYMRPVLGGFSRRTIRRRPTDGPSVAEVVTPWVDVPAFHEDIQLPHDLLR